MKIITRLLLLCFFSLGTSKLVSSQTVLNDKLIKIPKLVEVRHVDNTFFKEYFEVYIEQPIDHNNPKSETFKQRFCVGYNGLDVPNIIDLDGYAIDYAARQGYVNELSKTLKCNLVTVEHRYFGKSVPKNIDWKYLTIKQAAQDCHEIKLILETVMKGKWLATGTSKGGQTALAYRMYFPKDVEAAMVFGTPIRTEQNDKRLGDYFNKVAQTDCGKQVVNYQKILLEKKKTFLPFFEKYTIDKNLKYTVNDVETIYDYAVLYYQFCFHQSCASCEDIPTDTSTNQKFMHSLFETVPPRFFSVDNKQRSEASFYMFYNELGNYEYDLKPFRKFLKLDSYSNSIFCPKGVLPKFDKTYLTEMNKYISKTATRTIFIYGENDPWGSCQPEVKAKSDNYKYIIKNACHKTKLSELSVENRKELYAILTNWVGFKFPEEK